MTQASHACLKHSTVQGAAGVATLKATSSPTDFPTWPTAHVIREDILNAKPAFYQKSPYIHVLTTAAELCVLVGKSVSSVGLFLRARTHSPTHTQSK